MTIIVKIPKLKVPSIQLVIAALNEEQGIGLTIAEMKDTLGDIPTLVIDGKSIDRTAEISRNMGATVLIQDGKGKGDALRKALKYLDPNVAYIVLTDADYTYPAKYILKMIDILDEDPQVGMVCGNRFSENVDEKAFKKTFAVGNKLLSFAHKAFNGVKLQDPLTGLRVMRADLLKNWQIKSNGFDIEVELNNYITKQGYKIIETQITYRERLGEKKLKVKHGITILKRILKEVF